MEAPAQLIVALTNIVIALVMYRSVKEIVRDRKLRFLEKRIEYFYLQLIKYFGHGTLKRWGDARREVEEIIVSKRYLCGKKVAEVLRSISPQNKYLHQNLTFTSKMIRRRKNGIK